MNCEVLLLYCYCTVLNRTKTAKVNTYLTLVYLFVDNDTPIVYQLTLLYMLDCMKQWQESFGHVEKCMGKTRDSLQDRLLDIYDDSYSSHRVSSLYMVVKECRDKLNKVQQ